MLLFKVTEELAGVKSTDGGCGKNKTHQLHSDFRKRRPGSCKWTLRPFGWMECRLTEEQQERIYLGYENDAKDKQITVGVRHRNNNKQQLKE